VTEYSNIAIPTDLTWYGRRAAATIFACLRRHRSTWTGGCRAFYSPASWEARGERYGQGSLLLVVYDGSALADFFRLGDHAKRYDAMHKALERIGLYSQECTGWYSAIYETQPIVIRRDPSAGW
jgi:hypothetical protein